MKIALLIPVCSRDRKYTVDNFPLKDVLLSTFDFDPNFEYKIFLGSDMDDPFYINEEVKTEIKSFLPYNIDIHYFNSANDPVLVWNELFQIAYTEGFDYFYQMGDDIQIITKNSTSKFVNKLIEMGNIGVVGPTDINNKILLTQSFVHRSHMKIHGFYYPNEFKNWYCDNWITDVYKPDKSVQFEDIEVKNDSNRTPRYEYVKERIATYNSLIDIGKDKIKNYK